MHTQHEHERSTYGQTDRSLAPPPFFSKLPSEASSRAAGQPSQPSQVCDPTQASRNAMGTRARTSTPKNPLPETVRSGIHSHVVGTLVARVRFRAGGFASPAGLGEGAVLFYNIAPDVGFRGADGIRGGAPDPRAPAAPGPASVVVVVASRGGDPPNSSPLSRLAV